MESKDLTYRTSSYTHNGGNCVEVADYAGSVRVRDTKDRAAGPLVFDQVTWAEFVSQVQTR